MVKTTKNCDSLLDYYPFALDVTAGSFLLVCMTIDQSVLTSVISSGLEKLLHIWVTGHISSFFYLLAHERFIGLFSLLFAFEGVKKTMTK